MKKRGFSQLNSLKETIQLNYSSKEASQPANELEYQEMLRTAMQMQKTVDSMLKQCKQHSDQMPERYYSYEEDSYSGGNTEILRLEI